MIFTLLGLDVFGHFDTFPGGGGWSKSRLKTLSVPVGFEIGTELDKKTQYTSNDTDTTCLIGLVHWSQVCQLVENHVYFSRM